MGPCQNPAASKAVKIAAVALCASLGFASPLWAQTAASFEFTPFGGAYIPASEVQPIQQRVCVSNSIADTVTLGEESDWSGTPRAQSGWAAGARLTRWFSNGVGLEGSGSYADTGLPVQGCGANAYVGAHVINVSVRLLLRITGAVASVYALAGYGAFFHGGQAYTTLLDPHTDFGGVLGLGARVPLGSHALLQMRAEDYIYNLTLESAGTSFSSPGGIFTVPGFHYHSLQNDLVLSIGVSGSFAAAQRSAQ